MDVKWESILQQHRRKQEIWTNLVPVCYSWFFPLTSPMRCPLNKQRKTRWNRGENAGDTPNMKFVPLEFNQMTPVLEKKTSKEKKSGEEIKAHEMASRWSCCAFSWHRQSYPLALIVLQSPLLCILEKASHLHELIINNNNNDYYRKLIIWMKSF